MFDDFDYTLSFWENVLIRFQEFLAYLMYDRKWTWLEILISGICTLEVYLPLLKDQQLKHYADCGDTIFVSSGQQESYSSGFIPKKTLYCQDCIYRTKSKLAKFFYGEQMDGFCYYLGKGDFSFLKPTDLLWDGVKCCGKNEDIDEDYD